MADAFDPNLPELTGFDFSGLFPPSSGPAPLRAFVGGSDQPPQAPHPGQNLQQLMPLAAILPAILKGGGHVAMAAFLQGLNQAQQQRDQRGQQQFENQRQLSGDQRLNRQEQATEQYRQSELANQRQTQQDAFRQRVITAANNIDSPEQARALLDLLGGESNALGVPRSQVEAYVMQTATPSKLEQKAAQKYIGQLEKTYGQDWAEKVGGASFKVPGIAAPVDATTGQPRGLTTQELLSKSGLDMSGIPKKEDKPTADQLRPAMVPDPGKPGHTKLGWAAWDPKKQTLVPVASDTAPPPPASVLYPQTAAPMPDVLDARPDPATANKPDPKTGLTPNATFQNGATWALTGHMPSMGMGSRGQVIAARSAIQNTGAALAAKAGVDLPTLQAEYRANAGTLAKLLPQATATAAASSTANDNLDLALQQSPKVTRTDSAWVNQVSNGFVRGATPAANLTQFEVYIYTAAREYAKVTSGGAASTAGLTDSAAREAGKLLSAAQSPQAFAAAVQAMQNDMANVVKNQQKQLAGVSSTIANFFGAVNGVGPVQAGAAGTQPSAAPGNNPFRH